jgi:hypothetical protein
MIPVPLCRSRGEFEEPAREFQIGGTGTREKTNRCEAVKLEITGNRPVPDSVPNTVSQHFTLVSDQHRDDFAQARPSSPLP